MNNNQEKEVDIQSALSEFYCRCALTKINVQDNFINYKISGGQFANAYSLDHAEQIIRESNLPLKAEIIGLDKRILHISAK
jgi:hypothetical protein